MFLSRIKPQNFTGNFRWRENKLTQFIEFYKNGEKTNSPDLLYFTNMARNRLAQFIAFNKYGEKKLAI